MDPTDAAHWTVAEVGVWLDLLGFSKYKDEFSNQSVDGNTIIHHLTKEDLHTELMIRNLLDRKRIWAALEDLRSKAVIVPQHIINKDPLLVPRSNPTNGLSHGPLNPLYYGSTPQGLVTNHTLNQASRKTLATASWVSAVPRKAFDVNHTYTSGMGYLPPPSLPSVRAELRKSTKTQSSTGGGSASRPQSAPLKRSPSPHHLVSPKTGGIDDLGMEAHPTTTTTSTTAQPQPQVLPTTSSTAPSAFNSPDVSAVTILMDEGPESNTEPPSLLGAPVVSTAGGGTSTAPTTFSNINNSTVDNNNNNGAPPAQITKKLSWASPFSTATTTPTTRAETEVALRAASTQVHRTNHFDKDRDRLVIVDENVLDAYDGFQTDNSLMKQMLQRRDSAVTKVIDCPKFSEALRETMHESSPPPSRDETATGVESSSPRIFQTSTQKWWMRRTTQPATTDTTTNTIDSSSGTSSSALLHRLDNDIKINYKALLREQELVHSTVRASDEKYKKMLHAYEEIQKTIEKNLNVLASSDKLFWGVTEEIVLDV